MDISTADKTFVKSKIDEVLGYGRDLGKDETQYHCPFCSHHKPKLQINLSTQKWRCWICNSKGARIPSLLRRLAVPGEVIDRIRKIYGDSVYKGPRDTEEYVEVTLPPEYRPIGEARNTLDGRGAYSYLKRRGITDGDMLKHSIGYCETGLYRGRIIVPSYDADGRLNYFIARTVYDNVPLKYKNPPISKNIVCFESHIAWSQPVTLCEGVFDAIAIRRNAIPILGKTLSQSLIHQLLTKRPQVNIVLDTDAMNEAVRHWKYLTDNGLECKLVRLNGKDPSELGFVEVTNQIKSNTTSSFEDLIKLKLSI